MQKSLVRGAARAVLAVLFATAAQGQTASLTRDINSAGPGTGGSPKELYATPGKLFFAGLEGGEEGVWATDGTAGGTVLLTDLCLHSGCDLPRVTFLGDLGGIVLWTAVSEDFDALWRSDGTRAGTYPLAGPGTGLDNPSAHEPESLFHKGFFYFEACGLDTCGTYRTDGTAAGTVEVAPLGTEMILLGDRLFSYGYEGDAYALRVTDDPLAGSTLLKRFGSSAGFSGLTAAGNKVFFVAAESFPSDQLWVSDGTEAGTRVLTDFVPDLPFDYPRQLVPVGDRVYFPADDGIHGEEIWVSDGEPGGTYRVTDFSYRTPFFLYDTAMEEVNGRLVFSAHLGPEASLWSTDGTPGSLVNLPAGFYDEDLVLRKSEGRVFFLAYDRRHGIEPWTTDGTFAGTRRVADICPGRCSSAFYGDLQIVPWPGGILLRGADDGTHGQELWLSDGTAAGTRRITELESPTAFESIYFFTPPVLFAGEIWFAIDDGYQEGGLWATGGTPESTRLVSSRGRVEPASDPGHLTAAGGRLYFAASDGTAHGLWSTLGPPESTVLVQAASAHPDAGGEIRGAAASGSLVFFWQRIYPPSGPEEQLWRTDGTPAGTFLLGSDPGFPGESAALGGRFYFTKGSELWVSDGTVPGTGPFFSTPDPEGIRNLAAAGGALYFTAGDRLWRSDGTAEGTLQLRTEVFSAAGFVAAGPLVFFTAGNQLWKTDGTPAGTLQVQVDDGVFGLRRLTAFQGGVAFFANFEESSALFVSDGTAAVLVGKLGGEQPAEELIALGGRLWFPDRDAAHGGELWTSDGTAAGTLMVRDIAPGPRSSSPRGLAAAAGRLFFTAGDGIHGSELWVSDGTAAGTRMVQDLNPGPSSSEPGRLTVAGDRLYFSADDGIAGRELWSYPLAAGPGCQPAATRLCLNQGRFQVEAAWRDLEGRRGTGQAVALTPDTGGFWFFDPASVEAVLKVLDGRGVNDRFWVFYAGLSSVEYHLTVTDTLTGAARRYDNLPGQLASAGDANGFGPLGAFSSAPGPCQPTAERLCLNGGRFAVEAAWKDFQGSEGTGKAVGLTADTGWFWFFGPDNVEVMVKVLDGPGGKHRVFYGALSNVEYTLTVTDTQTGKKKIYRNPAGHFGSLADTGAF